MIADARALVERFDERRRDRACSTRPASATTYERQVHCAALKARRCRREPRAHEERSPYVNGRAVARRRRAAHAARRFPARAAAAHRHAPRLRARRLRRVHGRGRRRACALVHHATPAPATARAVRTIEGFDDDAVMARAARRLHRRARAAVRLLHAGHAGHRARHRAAPARRRRSAHPQGARRQSLPLHRLRRHRPRDRRACSGGTPRRSAAAA